MQVTTQRHGSVTVVAMQGSLDVITSPEAEKVLQEHLDHGDKSFVLDLSKLDFVSSAGIRTFLSFLKRAKAVGGTVRFAGLIKPVRQVFDIAGLSFRVAMFDTLEQALQGSPPEPPAAGASR
jgi:anti-anti-sigma factor